MPALSLPAPMMAELRAANAQRDVDFDGPHGLHGSLCPPGQIASNFNRLLVAQN
jgi:hypothetical protein